jgi:hypothetical protein
MDAAARDGFQMTYLQKLENERFTDENADPWAMGSKLTFAA